MPFISLKTNVKIDEKKEISLKERLGESIGIIPGKSEAWLMLDFEGDCRMYFKGSDSPLAFFDRKIRRMCLQKHYVGWQKRNWEWKSHGYM